MGVVIATSVAGENVELELGISEAGHRGHGFAFFGFDTGNGAGGHGDGGE
jgi:hypothetical protein